MAPPPVTPSPHRFVIKKERAIQRPLPPPEQTPRSSTQQFHASPRFTFSSAPRPTPSQSLPRATLAPSRYLTPGAKKATKEFGIIDISSDEFPGDVHDSIETDQQDQDLAYTSADLNDDGIEERSVKRRRVSTSLEIDDDEQLDEQGDHENGSLGDDLSSSLPILSSPPAPRRPVSTAASRFLSTTAPPSTPRPVTGTPNAQVFLKPPRFRPPDPATQAGAQGDPLPEQFSPHRKGQKYIPGGLAAEMRDWLVNIESAIPAQVQRESRNESPWLLKVVIDEVSGNEKAGMALVRGRQIHTLDRAAEMTDTIAIMRVILAGEAASTGLQREAKAEAGMTVGIKGPVWELFIEGEKWTVGVDWKVF